MIWYLIHGRYRDGIIIKDTTLKIIFFSSSKTPSWSTTLVTCDVSQTRQLGSETSTEIRDISSLRSTVETREGFSFPSLFSARVRVIPVALWMPLIRFFRNQERKKKKKRTRPAFSNSQLIKSLRRNFVYNNLRLRWLRGLFVDRIMWYTSAPFFSSRKAYISSIDRFHVRWR